MTGGTEEEEAEEALVGLMGGLGGEPKGPQGGERADEEEEGRPRRALVVAHGRDAEALNMTHEREGGDGGQWLPGQPKLALCLLACLPAARCPPSLPGGVHS